MKRAIALVICLGCATVSSTLREAHTASLQTQAATDLSCPKEQIRVSSTTEENWTAEGCGKRKDYVLKNPNCVVERDCIWQ